MRPFLRSILPPLIALGLTSAASASAMPAANAATQDNLIPNHELRVSSDGRPTSWELWSPRPELAAKGEVISAGGSPAIALHTGRYEDFGKWMTVTPAIDAGSFYRFETHFQAEHAASTTTSVRILLTWFKTEDGKGEIQRDYVLPEKSSGEAWREAVRTIRAPAEAHSVRIEFGLRCAPGGSAVWKDFSLRQVPAPTPRKIRIATTRVVPELQGASIEGNTQLMAKMLDQLAPQHPDVVLFSENLYDRFTRLPLAKKAQPIPGPLTEALGAKAKQLHAYVITTLHEVDHGLYYNTAVLIGRDGRVVGKYHKVHLTVGEMESGLTPGSEYPVFTTDFGRVGLLTCWDNWFPEPARALRLNGAEIIFFPLAGDGDDSHWKATWNARAADNAVWLVTASTVASSPSRIVDPRGEVIAEATGRFGEAVAEIDLNQEYRVRYLSVSSGLGEAKSFYIAERRPDTYSVISDPPQSEAAK